MKRQIIYLITCGLFVMPGYSQTKNENFISENISFASQQLWNEVSKNEKSTKVMIPRSVYNNATGYTKITDWTSGFFPGSLWYMYDLTKQDKWKQAAIRYTLILDSVKYVKNNHDVGFMIECSYGNGLRLTNNQAYKAVIVEAAKSLITRYRPEAEIIQSWNTDKKAIAKGWVCPVIIDNMMNLELLFNATRYTGDSIYWKIAVQHANTTLKNHFRKDNSCYHMLNYSPKEKKILGKHTVQGYSDESSWARGQAWAIYGYTVCYRYTKDKKYLQQAEKTLDFVLKNKNLPTDLIPYWDFNAPNIPNEPRDASSAAIIASALYEMSKYENFKYYKKMADRIMTSLASPAYRAKLNENCFYILMHSVGSLPHGVEIDVPLNYADYYFLEALKRKRDLEIK